MSPTSTADFAPPLDGELFKQIVSTANIGFGVQDGNAKMIYANDHLAKMLGFDDPAELIGADCKEFFCPESLAELRSNRQASQPGNTQSHRLTLCRRDGNRLRAVVSPYTATDETGKQVVAGAFVINVEEWLDVAPGQPPITEGNPLLDSLTARERQIVAGLLEGQSVARLAEVHLISTHTVRNHIKASYRKLGVHSRLDLMRVVMGGAPNRDGK